MKKYINDKKVAKEVRTWRREIIRNLNDEKNRKPEEKLPAMNIDRMKFAVTVLEEILHIPIKKQSSWI